MLSDQAVFHLWGISLQDQAGVSSFVNDGKCETLFSSNGGRRLGGEKDAPVLQSRAHQREQPEEPVGCLRGLLIRGARRLPLGFCDVRSPTGCLSIILYERGYSSCIRSIGERVPRPGPQCASYGVSSVSVDCTKVFRQ
ncbi:hypothetical protein ACOMHN_030438 [Nucella lapillus]